MIETALARSGLLHRPAITWRAGGYRPFQDRTQLIKVEAGDLLLSDTWDGGGCGDPLERYGVVVDEDLKLDESATKQLRERMRSERSPMKLFDTGFDSIEELKLRCQAETG